MFEVFVIIEIIFFGKSRKILGVGDDDYGGLVVVIVGKDSVVGNEGIWFVNGFEVFDGNVFFIREFDEVFELVDNRESIVFILLFDIISLELFIFGKGFFVKVRVFVVIFEDGRIFDENFILRRIVGGEVVSFRGVDKFDFSSRNGIIDSFELYEGGVEDGGYGCCFSKVVILNYND